MSAAIDSRPMRAPRSGRAWTAWIAAIPLVLAACGPDEPPAPSAEATDRAEIERLVALGYIEATEQPADLSQLRVVAIDRERAQPGYRLYCTRGRAIIELIELEGRVVREWRIPDTRHLMSCSMLDDGSIVIVGIKRPADGGNDPWDSDRYLARLHWNGSTLWRREIPVHHDVRPVGRDRLASIGIRYRIIPEVMPGVAVRDDTMMLLDLDGQVLEEKSVYDALTSVEGAVEILPIEPKRLWHRRQIDLLHTNTIEWIDRPHLAERHPLYRAGNVIITIRHQNLVAVIEWATNRLVWAWGQKDVIAPHEATVLENGHILVFDNGGMRGYSRLIELDPLTEEIVWEYRAEEPSDFFTSSRGGSQRLPNGNTLVTNSNNGYAFEVTGDGETVWRFMNPHLTTTRRRLTFRRMSWIPASRIDAIRARHPDPSS